MLTREQINGYFGNISKESENFLYQELWIGKYFVFLGHLFSLYIQDDDSVTEFNSQTPFIREKFLQEYLLPLLKDNKLKVKIYDLDMREMTIEEKIISGDPIDQTQVVSNTAKAHINLTPEQAINMIRERWNSYPTDFVNTPYEKRNAEQKKQEYFLQTFESWGVIFTLPENEWAI